MQPLNHVLKQYLHMWENVHNILSGAEADDKTICTLKSQ